MTRLHAAINELLPNVWEVLFACTKHVDALATRNLGVEVVFFRHCSDDDELLRCDLASRNSGNDGKCAVALDVCKESIVSILKTPIIYLKEMPVVQRRDDASNGRFAGLASQGVGVLSCFFHHRSKIFETLDVDDVEEVGARVLKVWAEMVLDLVAHGRHGLVENGLDERHAATAASAGFGARLDIADALAGSVFSSINYIAFGDVVA